MPRAATVTAAKPLLLVFGDDDFAVKQRAREVFNDWVASSGGMDQEIINATAGNSSEALKALNRLREALQTLPFFGGTKIVWFQDCNFLADDRTSSAKAVAASVADLAKEFKAFSWDGVRLLISAGKVDKRKVFYKACDSVGETDMRAGWSLDDKDWAQQAESRAVAMIRELGKNIDANAVAQLVSYVGPHQRQLHNEVEKITLFIGERPDITMADVETIVTRGKQARAFALGDALGDRNLPQLLRVLDTEMWEIRNRITKEKSEIGLLYGLISKVRVMLFLKEMLAAKWIKDEHDPRDRGGYNRFKTQLERAPNDELPADRRLNPLAMNPWMLYVALPHARNYSREELVSAMDQLLQCNLRLVTSGTDEQVVLQQTLVEIVGSAPKSAGRSSRR